VDANISPQYSELVKSVQTTPRTVAMTGGTGFIVRNLASIHHAASDVVRVLSRQSAKNAQLDGTQIHPAGLTKDDCHRKSFVNGADVLYRCASNSSDLAQMRSLHVGGTCRLLAAANGAIGHWVQLSSVEAYGPKRDGTVTVIDVERPVGPYESTKALADESVTNAPYITYTVLRPSTVFRAGMPNKSLLQIIDLVNRRIFFYVGRPGASANYVHVDNVVDARRMCATDEEATDKTHNLSVWRTMESFVATIASELNHRPPCVRVPENIVRLAARSFERVPRVPLSQARVDALTNRSTYDSITIRHEPGFTFNATMEQGLSDMVTLTAKASVKSRCPQLPARTSQGRT
jgi:nucleoside-diphosphate-sugar epimerase